MIPSNQQLYMVVGVAPEISVHPVEWVFDAPTKRRGLRLAVHEAIHIQFWGLMTIDCEVIVCGKEDHYLLAGDTYTLWIMSPLC
jgi:hypothetical protein